MRTRHTPERDIQKFMEYYRSHFPSATVLPKMHMIEDHMIPWLKQWHLGAGLMGEQGAESIHAHINKLEKDYSCIPNAVDGLRYLFKEYTLETCPDLIGLQPEVKRRKRRKKTS